MNKENILFCSMFLSTTIMLILTVMLCGCTYMYEGGIEDSASYKYIRTGNTEALQVKKVVPPAHDEYFDVDDYGVVTKKKKEVENPDFVLFIVNEKEAQEYAQRSNYRSVPKSDNGKEITIDTIIDKYNKKLSDKDRMQYKKSIAHWSEYYNIDPLLIAAIIARESSFNRFCTSSVGALGPMQVYVKQHRDRLKRLNVKDEELTNIDTGIRVGCDILNEYLGWKFVNGSMEKALKIYSGLGKSKYNWYYRDMKKIINTGYHLAQR